MGGGSCASQAITDDSYHDVHVRQLLANIQHHDGGDGIQESHHGVDGYQSGLREVGERRHEGKDHNGQGSLRGYATACLGVRHLESQWHGITSVSLLDRVGR